MASSLRARLESAPLPPAARLHAERAAAWRTMQAFYRQRSYLPAWVRDGAATPAARRLIDSLGALTAEGLDTRIYPQAELRRLAATVASIDPPARDQAAAELDVGLTYTFLVAAANLATGRVQPPEMVRVGWYAQPPQVDLVAALTRALGSPGDAGPEGPLGPLGALAPAAPGYVRLRQALAACRAAAAHGDRQAALRARQVTLNLERWRWSAPAPEGRYIVVNIPDFRLTVVDGGQAALTMKVIVGKTHQRTPVFSDEMTELVLNPAWRIPDSITTSEILPQLARDPEYLQRKGYEVRPKEHGEVALAAADLTPDQVSRLGTSGSPYRLVQPPGAGNALGRYKFVLRNPFDVYLHDTPTGQLFARSERDFSHGCIRLENPGGLAAYLLQDDPRWTPDLVEAALASGQTVAIPLPHRVPVHIFYRTAWVGADGEMELRPDVYGLDAWLAAELAAATPLWNDLQPPRRRSSSSVERPARASSARAGRVVRSAPTGGSSSR